MSLRKAIDAKCRECCYDPTSGLGSWRQQVEACPCTHCPLHNVRLKKRANRPLSQVLEAKSKQFFGDGALDG